MEKRLEEFYKQEKERDEEQKRVLQKSYDRIAWLRLVVFLGAVILIWLGLTSRPGKELYLIGGILCFIGFLVLIRIHDGIEKKQRLLAAREAVVDAYPARFGPEWREFPDDGRK